MNSSATGNAANEGSSTQQQQHVAASGGCASAPRIEAVTVYAGSGSQVADKFHEHAFELGKLIAQNGWVQVNGGGVTGLMFASTKGGVQHGGIVDTVILRLFLAANSHTLYRDQYVYDTLAERKRGLFDRGDAIVALPGGLGTLDELAEACCERHLSMHSKPIVVVNTDGFYDGLRAFFEHAVGTKFVASSIRDAVYFARDPEDAVRFIKSYRPTVIDKSTIYSGEMNATSAISGDHGQEAAPQ